jgi:hypothetical protein
MYCTTKKKEKLARTKVLIWYNYFSSFWKNCCETWYYVLMDLPVWVGKDVALLPCALECSWVSAGLSHCIYIKCTYLQILRINNIDQKKFVFSVWSPIIQTIWQCEHISALIIIEVALYIVILLTKFKEIHWICFWRNTENCHLELFSVWAVWMNILIYESRHIYIS